MALNMNHKCIKNNVILTDEIIDTLKNEKITHLIIQDSNKLSNENILLQKIPSFINKITIYSGKYNTLAYINPHINEIILNIHSNSSSQIFDYIPYTIKNINIYKDYICSNEYIINKLPPLMNSITIWPFTCEPNCTYNINNLPVLLCKLTIKYIFNFSNIKNIPQIKELYISGYIPNDWKNKINLSILSSGLTIIGFTNYDGDFINNISPNIETIVISSFAFKYLMAYNINAIKYLNKLKNIYISCVEPNSSISKDIMTEYFNDKINIHLLTNNEINAIFNISIWFY